MISRLAFLNWRQRHMDGIQLNSVRAILRSLSGSVLLVIFTSVPLTAGLTRGGGLVALLVQTMDLIQRVKRGFI